MRQLKLAFPFFVLISGLLPMAPIHSYAFVVNTTTYVEGNLSIDMDTAQGNKQGQVNRYELELDSRDGATLVTNVLQGGETQVDIEYVAFEDEGLLKPRLASEEKIGVNTCKSGECRMGVAGSSFEVQLLSSSSQGNFSQGTYTVDAQGVGKFGVAVAEKASTANPSIYENNKYELKGKGVFGLSGEYGFRGDVGEGSGTLSNPATGPPTVSEGAGSPEYVLSISGPSAVDENTAESYTALLTLDDGSSESVTEGVSWENDSSYATVDRNGILSASEVNTDETATIKASYTHEGLTETAEMVVTILDTNRPPSKPVIASPYDGQTDCDLQFQIATEAYSDPEGDSHGQSQWQISKNADFDPAVVDLTSTQQLTELTVPEKFLEADTTYHVRVRFYDIFLEPSEWSDTVAFTTGAEPSVGIEYTLSIIGPNAVDENTAANYTALVTFGNNTTKTVTEGASWGEDSAYASIDSTGLLSLSEVTADEPVTIKAFYTHEGLTETAEMVVTILDTNRPPSKPVIASPYDGQTDCDLQFQIATEAYSDPEGDSHGQSQWQISKNADFDPAVVDLTSTQQLTELRVPDRFLEADTTYHVRVRFYDIFLEPSEWSDAILFTTSAVETEVLDSGLSDEEKGAHGAEVVGDGVADSEPGHAPQTPGMEMGEITVDSNWKRIEFTRAFVDPVVIAKPISLRDVDPSIVRIRNVDDTGFEIRVQEWDYLDGLHSEETVGYLVVEAGIHSLPDGTLVEAGKLQVNNANLFTAVAFDQAFNHVPVVITAITTFNEAEAVTGRIKDVSASGFEFRMQEQGLNSQDHAAEEMSFIAWERSSGTVNDLTYEVNRTPDVVTHEFYTIPFTTSFVNPPVLLAEIQTLSGEDAASLRYDNKDLYGVDVKIEEEQSTDVDVNQAAEAVGYILLSGLD